jgi:MFS transporter, DHA2 family, multidrug resistance protein
MQVNRFLLTFAVMAATIMQVLDTTITNVALPHMAGELGATSDSISWVLTAYVAAASIFMPLTGYLTDRLGRRRYLLISIAGFVITSGLCGLAQGLYEMVAFRFLQGVFGAALVPLSQAIMVETFPAAERGKAMAIWGMGVMVAPIIGPSLGGYLTEAINWRWTFYINLPVGILSLVLAARYVPATAIRDRKMDWIGFAALSLAIAALQIFLDRGQQEDWFAANEIRIAAALTAMGLGAFLWHSLRSRGPLLFNLGVFKDRNFTVACLIMGAMGIGMFGGMLLQPLFLENLLAYSAFAAGMALVPRGVGTFLTMSLAGRLSGRLNPKWLVLPGVLLSMAGSYLMTRYTGEIGWQALFLPLLLQGMGMGLIFVPLSTLAFSTIPPAAAAEAAGIYSLIRSIGTAIGISVVSTFFARTTQAQWSLLRGHIDPFNPAVHSYLQNAPAHVPGIALLAKELGFQAQLTAFISSFWFITLSFLLMLPLVLLLRSGRTAGGAAPVLAD